MQQARLSVFESARHVAPQGPGDPGDRRTNFPMNSPYLFREIHERHLILWIDPNSTMAEIQRFVGIMGVFGAESGLDPLRFCLTPKKALKATALYLSNVTAVRGRPHPRFKHPTTGISVLRFSEALFLAKKLQGVPEGEKLTIKTKFAGLAA